MSITEDYDLPTSTLDCNVLVNIRQAVADFYQRCGLQYAEFKLDEALYAECCQEAINRGIPVDSGNYPVRAYMAVGVAMFCPCYAHLPDRAIRMWICLYSAVITCIDDIPNRPGGEDIADLYRFNERFLNCQPHGYPVLGAFDKLVREAHRYYSPLVANLIINSSLDFISGLLLERDTKGMQISAKAPSYPDYARVLTSAAAAYSLFIFPSTVPHWKYVQSMPDIMVVVYAINDILSFYKEEIAMDDGTNYISLVSASRGLTKEDGLCAIIDKVVEAHHNILECLGPHSEAYDAYVAFFEGYSKLHAALRRYKLKEVMLDG